MKIIIDSSGVGYGALYTTGELSDMGKETGVIFGFFGKILTYAEKFKSKDFYFCFDHKESYRKLLYKEYKENRNGDNRTEEELRKKASMYKQMRELKNKALYDFGFRNIFWQYGFESDDLMFLLSKKLYSKRKEEKEEILMVTGDSDMFQALDYCSIIDPRKSEKFTKKDFCDKFGILPNQWAECKAIGGCSTDYVKGVKGFGDPKSFKSKAIKYIKGEITSGKSFDFLKSKESQKIIKRNLKLVELPYKDDSHKVKKLILKNDDISKKKMIEVFDRYGFRSMLEKKKFDRWIDAFLK